MSNCPNCGQEQDNRAAFCSSCGQRLAPDSVDTISQGVNRCDFCAKSVTFSEYFTCKYCGKKFCYDHRLPENHLCKSASMRRVIPTSETYSSSGSYSYSSPNYRPRVSSIFGINFSKQGRNLVIAVILGLPAGFVLSLFTLNGIPLAYFFVQDNSLVFQGWVVPLVTSIIVVLPIALGLTDIVFNAIALFWLDRLFSQTYSARQYYAVFLATGVFGNIISLLNGPLLTSFGASGGIFGLIAGAVSNNYAVNRRLNPSLLTWFIIVFIFSSFTSNYVDWLAHLGGALLGLIAGLIIGRGRRPR